MLLNGNVFGNDDTKYYQQKLETNCKYGIRQRKVFNKDGILYIVEKVLKTLFNDNIFGNVDWNKYYQKHETNPKHGMSMKKFSMIVEYWISLKRSWKKIIQK